MLNIHALLSDNLLPNPEACGRLRQIAGNKRVARLAANIPLVKHNLCPLSFIDVPKRSYVEGILGVYELNRIELLRDVFVEDCCVIWILLSAD